MKITRDLSVQNVAFYPRYCLCSVIQQNTNPWWRFFLLFFFCYYASFAIGFILFFLFKPQAQKSTTIQNCAFVWQHDTIKFYLQIKQNWHGAHLILTHENQAYLCYTWHTYFSSGRLYVPIWQYSPSIQANLRRINNAIHNVSISTYSRT